MAPRSVLDDLGEEITGIVAPVSICMALVVVLVKALNPEGSADSSTVAIATIAYHEQDTDTAGQKLGGALLNAIIFMAVIAGMTFVLFLLFKWGCYKLIYGYMGFAMLNIFFFFTGALVLQILRLIGLHMDLLSLTFLLLNFSVVGILSLFFMPVPLFLKQCYTVWVGICVAYIFTHIPEWTSWVLLVIMALYDLAAVLMPGGPLKILVELAIERQQDLPALIYESRPVGRPYQRGMWRRGTQQQQQQQGSAGNSINAATGMSGAAAAAVAAVGLAAISTGDGSHSPAAVHVALLAGHPRSSDECLQELAVAGGNSASAMTSSSTSSATRRLHTAVPLAEGVEGDTLQQQQQQLLGQRMLSSTEAAVQHEQGCVHTASGGSGSGVCQLAAVEQHGRSGLVVGGPVAESREAADGGRDSRVPNALQAGGSSSGSRGVQQAATAAQPITAAAGGQHYEVAVPSAGNVGGGSGQHVESEEDDEFDMPDGIKLGLGDFIFYSMLVGRAAMYDMMTVYASYIAVISGLGITLMLLALYRKALPALPVSIALGVMFYFLTRLVMEPFVVPLASNLAYY